MEAEPVRSGGSSGLDRAYRPDIDGLRAIAILSVVLYHVGVPWLRGGLTGVDVFFVISGYLIGGHIYGELRGGCFSYPRFYQRRAKRILPALIAVILCTLLASLFLLSPLETDRLARSAVAATLSGSNLLYWWTADYFAVKSEFHPLLMTWSLGVEEQFYAAIPLLMVLLARLRRNWTLPILLAVCIASFLFAWIQSGRHPMMVFYTLPARAWELGAGVALAVVESNRMRTRPPRWLIETSAAVGIALMLSPIFLLTPVNALPGPAGLPSVIGTALVLATPASWINRRLLSPQPMVFIGKVSYSWYLIHWPVLALMHILYGGDLPIAAALLASTAAFGLAVLSYSFIEQPFRRSSLAAASLLVRYAVASAALLAISAGLWLGGGLPQRFPELDRMEAAEHSLHSDPCLAYDQDRPNLAKPCYDSAAANESIALWGDSHAAALAPGLRSVAAAQGYGFVELAKDNCTPLTGATHYTPEFPLMAATCAHFNRKVLDLLTADQRIAIVFLAGSWASPLNRNQQDGWLIADAGEDHEQDRETPSAEGSQALFVDSLTASIRALQRAGKQVYVMQDVPIFAFDPLLRARFSHIPARLAVALWIGVPDTGDSGFASSESGAAYPLAISAVKQAVADAPGATLVDLKANFCAKDESCLYRDGDRLLFIDRSHLSPDGARYAVRDLKLNLRSAHFPSKK
jgi:peptidoglycan/LPS O-acetylase OafA/YrhL